MLVVNSLLQRLDIVGAYKTLSCLPEASNFSERQERCWRNSGPQGTLRTEGRRDGDGGGWSERWVLWLVSIPRSPLVFRDAILL